MKLADISLDRKLIEQHITQSNLLLESVCTDLTRDQKYIVENIYREFQPLIEASLTTAQINKIFTDIESSATAAGGNRTALGTGKDVAVKANEIINKAGKWLQNTTPIKSFDQKFEELKRKINTTFPDSKLLDGISKLGVLAQEHPGKTAAIVGILTAIASLGAGPVGGAIAGQVLRGSVELLKGSKLSTAVGKGVKTAVFGYLTGEAFQTLGEFAESVRIKSIPFGPEDAGLERVSFDAEKITSGPGIRMSQSVRGVNIIVDADTAERVGAAVDKLNQGGQAALQGFEELDEISKTISSSDYKKNIGDALKGAWKETKDNDSLLTAITAIKQSLQAASQGAVAGAGVSADSKKESIDFSKSQLAEMFVQCQTAQETLFEAPLDALKGKVQQVGKNLTTKITADKLQKAWKAAGSPTDSDQVAGILRKAGVKDEILAPIYKAQGVELKPASASTPQPTTTVLAKGQSTAPTDANAIIKSIETMSTADLQQLDQSVDQLMNKPGGTASAGLDSNAIIKSIKTMSTADLQQLDQHIDQLMNKPTGSVAQVGKKESQPGQRQKGDMIKVGDNSLQWTAQPGKEWFIAGGTLSKPNPQIDRLNRIQQVGGKRYISANDAKRLLQAEGVIHSRYLDIDL